MNYIIFDLEATCWENEKKKQNEIIEIGAVKLNDKLEFIDTFAKFVKPVINPTLSEFCTCLTSITQKDVDGALSFEVVVKEFESFIGNEAALCSWGFYDKKQLINECRLKNYSGNICSMLENHISIKHQFAQISNMKPCGMKEALNILGLQLDGRHHRGIDDAINITKVFKAVFDELKLPCVL